MHDNARYVAYEIIYEVMYHNGYSNLLLQNKINHFTRQDKALITKLVYGVLQNYDLLKYQLSLLDYRKLTPKNEVIILISLYQKYFLDKIPDYAIVNEALKIVKQISSKYETNFVAALLNQAFQNDLVYLESADPVAELSIKYSHPQWLIKLLFKQYGAKKAEQILANNHQEAEIFIRYNPLSEQVSRLHSNDLYRATDFAGTFVYHGDSIKGLAEYQDGIISVQDLASQQVARLLNPQPGMKVLDMCAAPGTKTTHLAELMHNQGHIDAVDIHQHRLQLIKQNAQRLGLDIIKVHCYDSTKLDDYFKAASYDMILCDAVCTGLGVIKRKPEIKYQDITTSMDRIIEIQQALLEQAYRLLKPGGQLVYATCTLNKKENEKQVAQFLAKHDDLTLSSEQTIFNFEYNSDGFYMALIVKK